MSEGIGPVRITAPDAEVFLGRDLAALQQVSPETLDKLDVEIRMLVEEGRRIARTRLQERRAQVELLADELDAYETVDGDRLAKLLAPPPRRTRRATTS
jgi:cell division protease FtsH